MTGLNLGTEAVHCLRELQQSPYFERFREHFAVFVYRKLHEAVASPVDQRIEATAYARALRDMWIAFESAALEKPQRSVELPMPSATDRALDLAKSSGAGRMAKALSAAAGNTEGVL